MSSSSSVTSLGCGAHVDGVVTPRAVAASTAFGAKVAADKFPDYVFAIDELVRAPDIRCVAIYRDCRDVASSFLQKVRTTWKHQAWVEGLDDAAEISRRWVRSLEIMEAESERVLAIKYEDLVRQPAAELKRLALWLDVDPYTFRIGDVRDTSIGKFARGADGERAGGRNRRCRADDGTLWLPVGGVAGILMVGVLAGGCDRGPGRVAELRQQILELAPLVDATRLRETDHDTANWLTHGRTYAEDRFSPLRQIHLDNN